MNHGDRSALESCEATPVLERLEFVTKFGQDRLPVGAAVDAFHRVCGLLPAEGVVRNLTSRVCTVRRSLSLSPGTPA